MAAGLNVEHHLTGRSKANLKVRRTQVSTSQLIVGLVAGKNFLQTLLRADPHPGV